MLVFRTTQNNPLKIHLNRDTVEFSMPEGVIVCELQRGGIKSKIACDASVDLIIEFSEKVFLRFSKQKNQVVVYIKADDDVQVLRDKYVNQASDINLSSNEQEKR